MFFDIDLTIRAAARELETERTLAKQAEQH